MHEERKKIDSIKKAAKDLGHVPEYQNPTYMTDGYICSCGWKSRTYFDGEEYAFDEWKRHAQAAIEAGQVHIKFD